MIALLDVNVLVALLDSKHLHHLVAQSWFNRNASNGWASCPITQNGCIRVLSALSFKQTAQGTLSSPHATGQIARRLKNATQHTSHQFLSDDLSILNEDAINFNLVHGHRQITDIYLLALARKHDMALASFDLSIPIAAVVGARSENLINPAK